MNTGWVYRTSDPLTALHRRQEFMDYLRSMGSPDGDYDAAALAYGELVANVLRHAPGPIEIVLEWENEDAVLHIIDHGNGFICTPVLPAEPLAETGRGLFLVRQLTKNLTVFRHDERGAEVRVVLPIRRKRAAHGVA